MPNFDAMSKVWHDERMQRFVWLLPPFILFGLFIVRVGFADFGSAGLLAVLTVLAGFIAAEQLIAME